MPLSSYEHRILAEISDEVSQQDPKLARELTSMTYPALRQVTGVWLVIILAIILVGAYSATASPVPSGPATHVISQTPQRTSSYAPAHQTPGRYSADATYDTSADAAAPHEQPCSQAPGRPYSPACLP